MNGYELISKLERTIREIIEVPNSWLPENFQDHRTSGVTLADLDSKCDSLEMCETEHQIEKQEKNKRIALYSSQIESGQEISYLMKGT